MQLLCITGMDGAGKTTLARRIVSVFQERHKPAVYVYGRTYPLVSRLLMAIGRAAFLRKKDVWQDYQGYETSKKSVMRNPLLAWFYKGAIWVDYYCQAWLKLLPHVLSRRTVVLDRYIYDTVISDLSAHLSYTPSQIIRSIERGLRFLPRPAKVILIDLPAEVAFARKDDVPHLDYLYERRRLYQILADQPGFVTLDGSQDADTILAQAMHVFQS